MDQDYQRRECAAHREVQRAELPTGGVVSMPGLIRPTSRDRSRPSRNPMAGEQQGKHAYPVNSHKR